MAAAQLSPLPNPQLLLSPLQQHQLRSYAASQSAHASLLLSPQHFSGMWSAAAGGLLPPIGQPHQLTPISQPPSTLFAATQPQQHVMQQQQQQQHQQQQHQQQLYTSVVSAAQLSGQQMTPTYENQLSAQAAANGDSIRFSLNGMQRAQQVQAQQQNQMQQQWHMPQQPQQQLAYASAQPAQSAGMHSPDSTLPMPHMLQLLQSTVGMRAMSLGGTVSTGRADLSHRSHGMISNGFSSGHSHMRSSHSNMHPTSFGNGHRHGQFSSPVLLVTLLHRFFTDDPDHAFLIPRMRVSLQRTSNAASAHTASLMQSLVHHARSSIIGVPRAY